MGTPFVWSHCFRSSDKKEEPLSECTYPGKPNMENIDVRLTITDSVFTSLQGIAKGKREYSSVTVNMYLFADTEGNGPLKSILSRSKVELP